MSNLISFITPEIHLQEVYDGKNHYVPSFFRIKLGVYADFFDVANMPFGSFAAFFHEYVHYLQDVTTLYGLMNLGNITYYVRDAAARISKLPKGEFSTPVELDPNKRDFGYRNFLLRKEYNGSPINPKHHEVQLLDCKVLEKDVDGIQVEYVCLKLKDSGTNEEFHCKFGGNILTEGMAYMVERWCNEREFSDKGFRYPGASEYPYWINYHIAQYIYPEIADEIPLLVGLADLSLLTYNCGLTYVRLLEHLRDIRFMDSVTPNQYYESIERLYEIGHQYIHWSIDHFKKMQDYVLSEAAYYFKMPIASECNDWLTRVWYKAYQLRQLAPRYIMDVMLANNQYIRDNKCFATIYYGLGTPLIVNGDDEGTIVPPEGFKPTKDFIPGLYWAIDEVARIFQGSPKSIPCQLKEYCIRSNQELGHNVRIDSNCDNSPWLRGTDEDALCPVGAIWKHWSLNGHNPK